jgi:hypothetical protein
MSAYVVQVAGFDSASAEEATGSSSKAAEFVCASAEVNSERVTMESKAGGAVTAKITCDEKDDAKRIKEKIDGKKKIEEKRYFTSFSARATHTTAGVCIA